MQTVKAIYVYDEKNCHKFKIDAGHRVKGELFIKKSARALPKAIRIDLVVNPLVPTSSG